MKGVKIKKISDADIQETVDIWYETSIQAHDFIPNDYWKVNKSLMKDKYIPMSETYVATYGKILLGFVSMIDEYLAAIFVRTEYQNKGAGSQLLDYIKNIRDRIQLKVYMKNEKSIKFYKNKGFIVVSTSIDKKTGEKELVMEWNRYNI